MEKLGVSRINNLMDNTWGVSHSSSLTVFQGAVMPLDQARLLLLFDTLRLPWEWKKQPSGVRLEIIGHHIDPKALSFSLTPEKKAALVEKLRSFTHAPAHTLRVWQAMLGWASWGLNSFPYGRHALQSSWDKLANKTRRFAPIPVNCEVQDDLRWLSDSLEQWEGQHFLSASIWPLGDADALFITDACTTSLGIWAPSQRVGFHHALPAPLRDIFWMELHAAALAIGMVVDSGARRIFVVSDSMNVRDLFLSQAPTPVVRALFRAIVRLVAGAGADVKVAHLPGAKNKFADALSRGDLAGFSLLDPKASLLSIPLPDRFPDGGFRR